MTQPARCTACGQQVYRDGRGRTLMHTIRDYQAGTGRVVPEVCPGSTKGARP